MKNTIKIVLLLSFILFSLFCIPSISSAANIENATDEASLISAIQNVDDGGTVKIQNNITVTGPIVIQKELTIDGNGYTISGSTDWTSTSGNQSMFTAQFAAGKLTLKNINLNNGPKYGVQSYDGASVILNNVSIIGFRYGGVIANGGKVEVIDLHLGDNGTGKNNGIEIDKGSAATNNPSLTINGILKSDSNVNVVRLADNGHLTEFTVTNTENTTNKVVIAGDKIVLTDKNNVVISESKIPDNVTANTDEAKKVMITLMVGKEVEKQIVLDEGTTITAKELESHIKVEKGYKVEGFYTDETHTKSLDFNSKINTDMTIYAKIVEIKGATDNTEEKKDEVPKTGVENYLGVAILAIIGSGIGIAYNKKRG